MRGLSLRLIVPLAAVVLMGVAVAYVAFVLWSQVQLSRERQTDLRAAALQAALVGIDNPSPLAALTALAAENEWILTLVNRQGSVVSTAKLPAPLPDFVGKTRVLDGGYEHVAVRSESSNWCLAVASRRIETTIGDAYAWQGPVFSFFVMLAVAMVALGYVFLRRAVVHPVSRITRLVGDADRAGLSQFGLQASDDFGRLSIAILGMTEQIENDRQRIVAQLDELRCANEELQSTQQQLVRAERLAVVGSLAAGLAHEVGNPLAVVSGYVEVLQDADLPKAELDDVLKHMSRELDRIVDIVRDLLDFSRAPVSAAGECDIGEVLEHVNKLLAPQERLREVDLQMELPKRPIQVAVDSGALTQVLLNLLLNAADAVRDGEARDGGTVRVTTELADDTATVVVDDSGPGIEETLRGRVFEPFYTTKAAGKGTGLGLAVCEHIITSAGGEISVSASPLSGARFVVTLPVAGSRGQ
ncbi:MAG: hypothetical protein A2289_08855 [Deltaproteobacteria bacterium RIFOXYA12_FULL_58_15]|nr:MAG: hypothetical protein A2289_08855 [Deltaproteobacteria bacterium RIFOXYA12_FULL_58_15]OGR10559.1 MAG: hypothetical protein A2341_09735 [Deltaproteobacteria bacterium RIFOXYB12_FULL_58_9]